MFPLVGVLALGWDVVALLLLYWVEIGIVLCWSGVEALFAERRSTIHSTRVPLDGLFEKRGGVRLWRGGPRVYPRNVPHTVGLLAILGGVWAFSGYSLFVLQGQELLAWTPSELVVGTVLVGAVGAFVARGVTFRSEYLGDEEYREVSAQAVAAGPATYLLTMWAFASVVEALVSTETSDVVAFVGVVGVKLGYDLYRYRTGPTASRVSDIVANRLGTDEESARTTIETPDEEPTARFFPNGRAVRLGGLLIGLGYALSVHGIFVLFPLWFLLQGATGVPVATSIVVGIVAAITAGKGIEQYVQYGSMEYGLSERSVAGYDRCLATPQWRVAYDEIETVTVTRGLSGRLSGTGTVRIRTSDGRVITLAHLPDAKRVSERVDTRVR
ncbi:PH domain-containing protein [Halorussus sp. MSC15.2]|nr:PH domain-containing protein [Halorussus sp. MSC15.2]